MTISTADTHCSHALSSFGKTGHEKIILCSSLNALPFRGLVVECLLCLVQAALWASYGETERTAVRNLLGLKAKTAADLQQLVELRRQMWSATAAAAAAAVAPLEEKSLPGSPEDEAQHRLHRLQVRHVCGNRFSSYMSTS